MTYNFFPWEYTVFLAFYSKKKQVQLTQVITKTVLKHTNKYLTGSCTGISIYSTLYPY